ncbi:hypothetical protein M422DRAFT_41715 [Sphaerobolus stellatus SS14]|nr:hypothetical protein M422DRAFT_41715 [Sphaerobolus stellatus SS14]
MALPGPILALMTVLRVEFRWRGWIPVFQRLPPSHRERASQRLDAQFSTWKRLLIFLSLVGLYVVFSLENWEIISSEIPEYESTVTDPYWLQMLDKIYPVFAPMWLSGKIFQLIFNYRCRSFTGMYKTQAYLVIPEYVFLWASFSRVVIGNGAPLDSYNVFERGGFSNYTRDEYFGYDNGASV